MHISPETIELISSYITRDNITLALAILGSLGTLSSWFFSFFNNRKCLKFNIIGHRKSEDMHSLLIYATFENKSRLPISITGICVKLENSLYSCEKIPVTAFEETIRSGKNILSHREYVSMNIPFYITGLGCASGYIYFEFPEETLLPEATHLTFRVISNRGKVIQKLFSLGHHLD